MTAATMTRSEREDLQRLVRQSEKVLKSAAKQRSKDLIADFENQMGQEYAFDQDATWKQAAEAAEREVQKAQKLVAARCRELGIPERFAPSLSLGGVWTWTCAEHRLREFSSDARRSAACARSHSRERGNEHQTSKAATSRFGQPGRLSRFEAAS